MKKISLLTLKKQNVQAIKCPYFLFRGKIFYEYALLKCDYLVTAFTPIKFPETNSNSNS